MRRTRATAMGLAAAMLAAATALRAARFDLPQAYPGSVERRAIAFLSSEVPRWHTENRCYSCHNNGDAARALILAAEAGVDVSAPLADTLAFLAKPDDWERNSRGGGLDDTALARIQFAGALASAVEAGLAPRSALLPAARLVLSDQTSNGSWQLDPSNSLGSPATYGTALATWAARRSLRAAASTEFEPAIRRADLWLQQLPARDTPDLAAVILTFAGAVDPVAAARADAHERTLLERQAPDGGWGPFALVRSEPFDTAVAVLALHARPPSADRRQAIARGLTWLRRGAQDDGSWVETTRPAGQRSYAQRISTTGWALAALLTARQTGPPEVLPRRVR